MYVTIKPKNQDNIKSYVTMPLKKNIPRGRKGWIEAVCPRCKKSCWERPLIDEAMQNFTGKLCTECAIKQVMKNKK